MRPKGFCGFLRELPPRARRIPYYHSDKNPAQGTTSACAENTWGLTCCFTHSRNYLRVRGEYVWQDCAGCGEAELPPRARRIQVM